MPSRHAIRWEASSSARAMTSSSVSVPSGNLPVGSSVMTCSRVGHSARMPAILFACWAFSTKMAFAFTLLMTNAAWPGSDWG